MAKYRYEEDGFQIIAEIRMKEPDTSASTEYLVSTTAYAALHGKDPSSVRALVAKHRFQSAIRLGRNWFIDRREPWPQDGRVTSGNYRDWRKKTSEP